MAALAHAFAKAGRPAPSLLRAIEGAALSRMDAFRPQDLANLVWGFAKAGQPAPALYDAAAAAAAERIKGFDQVHPQP